MRAVLVYDDGKTYDLAQLFATPPVPVAVTVATGSCAPRIELRPAADTPACVVLDSVELVSNAATVEAWRGDATKDKKPIGMGTAGLATSPVFAASACTVKVGQRLDGGGADEPLLSLKLFGRRPRTSVLLHSLVLHVAAAEPAVLAIKAAASPARASGGSGDDAAAAEESPIRQRLALQQQFALMLRGMEQRLAARMDQTDAAVEAMGRRVSAVEARLFAPADVAAVAAASAERERGREREHIVASPETQSCRGGAPDDAAAPEDAAPADTPALTERSVAQPEETGASSGPADDAEPTTADAEPVDDAEPTTADDKAPTPAEDAVVEAADADDGSTDVDAAAASADTRREDRAAAAEESDEESDAGSL
jgi:hypothetical protein